MKKPTEAKPARLPKKPKPPKRPAATSEQAKAVLADDTDERRAAASAYLDSERRAARTGIEIPDLPLCTPDPR